MSSIKPDSSGGKLNGGEEIASGFVVAGGNGSELLEFAKEVLDQMTCLVQMLIIGTWHLAISPGRVILPFLIEAKVEAKQPRPISILG